MIGTISHPLSIFNFQFFMDHGIEDGQKPLKHGRSALRYFHDPRETFGCENGAEEDEEEAPPIPDSMNTDVLFERLLRLPAPDNAAPPKPSKASISNENPNSKVPSN